MNYFISRNGQQYGPYTLADLQRYVASGNILVTDLARSEAMAEWASVAQIIGNIPVPAITTAQSAVSPLRQDGDKLVVSRGATLPAYCVKCGRAVDSQRWDKNFSWVNPLLGLLVFAGCIGIIVYLIVYFTTRKQMQLSVPLCKEHWDSKTLKTSVAAGLMIGSPILLIVGAINNSDAMLGGGAFLLFVMLIAGAILLVFAAPLRPKKIDDAEAVFSGAGAPFLQIISSSNRQTLGAGY